ncbi:DUF4080 domain-containing protein [Terrimonas rubra]|uniref:DUF4080 domain-containing protein n=1 Tax=Terrimonas rubra TaxID=1035890 RepID=A0ABW6A9K1_9BACT
MSKILLSTLNAKYIHLNLAIRILYDLNKDREGLSWHEFTIKSPVEEIVDHCAGFDVICFSCYIWNITPTLKAAEAIKAKHPHIKILLGGPEVSYEWEQVIAQPCIDYIIVGEGEIPFTEFVHNYPLVNNIPNLIYKTYENDNTDGHIHYNKQDISFDVAAFENRNPYQYDDPTTLAHKVSYIETSRGCPYKCSFCLASLDNKVRYLPMQTIKDNLLYLMQHGRVIKFLDRTFNIKKDFTLELFQFILDNHRPGNVFQFEITADIVHPDIIAFINEKVPTGLFRFEIGIQTVNQQSNLEVSRKQNFEKTSKVIKALDDRIEMHLDLIVGLPLEYWNDLKFSFESVFKLFPPELQLGFLKFLKGTPVREKYEQYGYVFDPMPPYQIIKSNFLSEEELHAVTLLEHALEVYWNKKRACHTLRYITGNYSIFDFLLGLGKLFAQKHSLHRYNINDVFAVLKAFIDENYSDDPVVNSMLALDYYTYFTVKPRDIGLMIWDKERTGQFAISHALNHHKNRFVIVPVAFQPSVYFSQNLVIPAEDIMVIEYNNREKGNCLASVKSSTGVPVNNE